MSQHDFHIALVLLALITAGILGYHSLNTESGNGLNNCTLALCFSSFDGCNSSNRIEVLSPKVLDENLYDTFTTEKIGISDNIHDGTSHRIPKLSDEISASTKKNEADTMQFDYHSFLVSDAHGEFIDLVKINR